MNNKEKKMSNMSLKQKMAAMAATGLMGACALVPLAVSNKEVAPTAEAAALYTCVLDARIGMLADSSGTLVISSSKVSCIGAYTSPSLRVTHTVYRNGTPVVQPGSVIISPRAMPFNVVTHAKTTPYYRCSTYKVISRIYAGSTGKNIGYDDATFVTNC